MFASRFLLAPKCIPICYASGHTPMISRHVTIPETSEFTNEVKYYLMKLSDTWKRYCASSTLHKRIEQLDKKYHKLSQKYMSHCAQLDELETNFARDLVDIRSTLLANPQGSVEFQTRYSLRIAEIKRFKNQVLKEMILTRIQIIAVVGSPMIECMFHLFRIFPDHVFTQSADGDYTHIINQALVWINVKCIPELPFNANTVDIIVQTLENYIDFRMQRDPEKFVVRGVDYFTNQCCTRFFQGVHCFRQRREAFTFLLVAKRYRRAEDKRNEQGFHGRKKLLNEMLFFLTDDLVKHTLTFLIDVESYTYPEYFLWM